MHQQDGLRCSADNGSGTVAAGAGKFCTWRCKGREGSLMGQGGNEKGLNLVQLGSEVGRGGLHHILTSILDLKAL